LLRLENPGFFFVHGNSCFSFCQGIRRGVGLVARKNKNISQKQSIVGL
jgi:hypothetical protein